jgi:hypothetical protein
MTDMPADIDGYLEDLYLNSRTKLAGGVETVIPFTVTTDSASFKEDRFRIVFMPLTTLPLHLLGVKAIQQNEGVSVKWTAESEVDMDRYEVEKSADGQQFKKIGSVLAKENPGPSSSYNWFDLTPFDGDNFYRIRSLSKSGEIKYSSIAKVRILKGTASINLYPNPLTGKVLSLVLNNIEKDEYVVNIFNTSGQIVHSVNINHPGGSVTHPLRMFKTLPPGIYQLHILIAGKVEKISLMVQQ